MSFFRLTPEQRMLQQVSAEFIQAELPVARVRELLESGGTTSREHVEAAAELGWYAALIPEEHGGGSVSGDGVADLAVVAELRGRYLQPPPFAGSNVAAAALGRAGATDPLPAIASGASAVAWVGRGLRLGVDAVGLQAEEAASGVAIADVAVQGTDATGADWLLVALDVQGRERSALIARDTPGVAVEQVEALDLTTGAAVVRFSDVTIPHDGLLEHCSHAEDVALGALLTVADSVGAMSALFDMTLEYAREREAFGQPIGGFQAVKHQIADASMLLHASKAVAGAATEALATGHPDRLEVVSIAKAFVSEKSFDVAQTCLQIHGGIGYAWEHDLHLFLRRLAANSSAFGDAAWHRARISARHEPAFSS